MPKVIPEYKEQARKKILATAGGVFAERGYHEATMDDVARKIGVSKGAVYQYFESKEKLFQELCLVNAEHLEEALKSEFLDVDFRRVADERMDSELAKRWDEMVLMFEALAEVPRNKVLQKVMQETYSTYVRIVTRFVERMKKEGKLSDEIDSASVARVMVAFRNGVLVNVLQGLGREDARRVWKDGVDFIVEGVFRSQGSNSRAAKNPWATQ